MMKELSLNILDVAGNSLAAGASEISIEVDYQPAQNRLTIAITDNGCGMDEKLVKKVTDPFYTTKTTRKVGLGLPFFKQAAELAGGGLDIDSEPGKGTSVKAVFLMDHIDRMPMGDLAGTVAVLLAAKEVRYVFRYRVGEKEFAFDTNEAGAILGEVSISNAEVIAFLKDYISQGIMITNGGSKIL